MYSDADGGMGMEKPIVEPVTAPRGVDRTVKPREWV